MKKAIRTQTIEVSNMILNVFHLTRLNIVKRFLFIGFLAELMLRVSLVLEFSLSF